MAREDEFYNNAPITSRENMGGSQSGYKPKGGGKDPKTFEQLSKVSDTKKEAVLFSLFNDLHNNRLVTQSEGFKRQFDVYSGVDEEFKKELQKFLGESCNMYNGMDLNSIVKSVANKIIQPFMSKDDVLTVTPLGINVELADRISALLNHQMLTERFLEEAYKVLKDGLIYGIGFMSVGWEIEYKRLEKRVLRAKQTDSIFNPVKVTIEDPAEYEDVFIEEPDFKAESVGNIMYPEAARWEEIPYVIRKELISRSILNEKYNLGLDEFGRGEGQRVHQTQFELDQRIIVGTASIAGDRASDLVEVLHFYFRDGSYYVAQLSIVEGGSMEYISGLKIIYSGESPVPGLAIPIIPFIPDPITNRITGESVVTLGIGEQRKITEIDNLMMNTIRNQSQSPIAYTPDSGLDLAAYRNRTPGMPFEVKDLSGIRELVVSKFDPAYINLRDYATNNMQRLTGQTDFAQGNIGRSARLSGVDSLVGLAMSRLAMSMSQFNYFILGIADALVLLNRAFLPLDYGKLDTSLHAEPTEQLLEIPYPLNIKIRTSISGSADKSITLGAYREAVQLAFQMNQMEPGSVDIQGLVQRFFSEAGLRDISRYFTKSPMTLQERQTLLAMDKIIASQMSPGGTPLQPQDPNELQQQQGFDISGQGQAGGMGSLQEQTGFGL